MILAVALSAQDPASLSLKADGGGLKEDDIQAGKQAAAASKHRLFDQVLRTSGCEQCSSLLLGRLFSEKDHDPVEVMQAQLLDSIDHIVTTPAVTGVVRTGGKKPVEHGQEDGPFNIELELAFCQ